MVQASDTSRTHEAALPHFTYHPNPLADGAIVASRELCEVCEQTPRHAGKISAGSPCTRPGSCRY
ncbi:CbrC family protein [Nocardioides sp. CGMCC 1.13656]|nr:CbrC family protein [Nocardioides sp. CGMCC 1.13656]